MFRRGTVRHGVIWSHLAESPSTEQFRPSRSLSEPGKAGCLACRTLVTCGPQSKEHRQIIRCIAPASFTHTHTLTPTPLNWYSLHCACEFYTHPSCHLAGPPVGPWCLARKSLITTPCWTGRCSAESTCESPSHASHHLADKSLRRAHQCTLRRVPAHPSPDE
jgi:hypothetical protein